MLQYHSLHIYLYITKYTKICISVFSCQSSLTCLRQDFDTQKDLLALRSSNMRAGKILLNFNSIATLRLAPNLSSLLLISGNLNFPTQHPSIISINCPLHLLPCLDGRIRTTDVNNRGTKVSL